MHGDYRVTQKVLTNNGRTDGHHGFFHGGGENSFVIYYRPYTDLINRRRQIQDV